MRTAFQRHHTERHHPTERFHFNAVVAHARIPRHARERYFKLLVDVKIWRCGTSSKSRIRGIPCSFVGLFAMKQPDEFLRLCSVSQTYWSNTLRQPLTRQPEQVASSLLRLELCGMLALTARRTAVRLQCLYSWSRVAPVACVQLSEVGKKQEYLRREATTRR